MNFYIFNSVQQENKFFRDNINTDWGNADKSVVSQESKFHYFKFLNIIERNGKQLSKSPIGIIPFYYEAGNHNIDKIIQVVKENFVYVLKHKIVFLDPLEGNHNIAEDIDYFVNYFNDSLDVYFISGDLKLRERKNRFTFVYNDQWIHHISPPPEIIPYNPTTKDYINCNRVARMHRCMLMQSLIDNHLLQTGYNTWANTYGAFDEFKRLYPKNTITNQKYDVLDIKNVTEANPTNSIPIEYCKKTFLYLNTETHVDNKVLFISEKTYKPIAIGMPFMTLGNPGTLARLRDLGFITFNKWFDERYDFDLTLEERIAIIVSNLNRLRDESFDRKTELRKEMEPVCKHNQNLYRQLHYKNDIINKLDLIKEGQIK